MYKEFVHPNFTHSVSSSNTHSLHISAQIYHSQFVSDFCFQVLHTYTSQTSPLLFLFIDWRSDFTNLIHTVPTIRWRSEWAFFSAWSIFKRFCHKNGLTSTRTISYHFKLTWISNFIETSNVLSFMYLKLEEKMYLYDRSQMRKIDVTMPLHTRLRLCSRLCWKNIFFSSNVSEFTLFS